MKRSCIKQAVFLLGVVICLPLRAPLAQEPSYFKSEWSPDITRTWIGPEYWANRLQDWQIRAGRLESIAMDGGLPMRTVHLLTHELVDNGDGFSASIRTGMLGYPSTAEGDSWSGFLIGAGQGDLDYRAASLIHHYSGQGGGIIVALDDTGRLTFRSNEDEEEQDRYPELERIEWDGNRVDRQGNQANWEDLELHLQALPISDSLFRLTAQVIDYYSKETLSQSHVTLPAKKLLGNIALVSHGGRGGKRYWFRDLELRGGRFERHEERKFGPVLNTFYTLNKGVLKLTAQFPPLGFGDERRVQLMVKGEEETSWKQVAETYLLPGSFTAQFRVEQWDVHKRWLYRVRYLFEGEETVYDGVVQREPTQKEELVVAAINCYQVMARPADGSWGEGFAGAPQGRWTPENAWFPHRSVINTIPNHGVDLLTFLGDQVYE